MTNKSSDNKKKGNKSNKNRGTQSSNDGSKHCMCHGNGNHATEDCDVLKKLAEQKKARREGSSRNDKGGSYNKTWKRKGQEGSEKSKRELAAFIEAAVQEGVQKELAALDSKKHKV